MPSNAPPTRPHGLSKSRYVRGLQCVKQLWWVTHEPDAPELVVAPSLQMLFDRGTRVGEVARDHVPGGVLIDAAWHDHAGKLAGTQAALASDATAIYEASFVADGVFVAVDILLREPGGWRVIEVKSTLDVKPQHLDDAALQFHVLRRAGLDVTGVDVMVLNRDCTFPDLSNLFRREDVTERVDERLGAIPGQVHAQLAALAGSLPVVAIGPHCNEPYACPFQSRCWPELPPHHVSTLYRIGVAGVAGLESRGIVTIGEVPEGTKLNAAADRQRRAVQAGRMLVEGDLAAALARFEPPLAYLDFETVMPAIPVWNGCHPYEQVAVQFSCHRVSPRAEPTHHAWVASGPADPRRELAERVIAACADARTVVAYNMSFEKACLERLARALPELATQLRDIIERLADPLPVIQQHVYHPDFGGSFSLKRVLPALVPGVGYDGLEIADGETASLVLGQLLFASESLSEPERIRLEHALLAYCERDTYAIVRLVERLRELAQSSENEQ